LIIEPKDLASTYDFTEEDEKYTINALKNNILLETYNLYKQINSISADCPECAKEDSIVASKLHDTYSHYQSNQIKLEDICLQPLSPENKNCAIQSIFQYWQNDDDLIRSALGDPSVDNSTSHLSHLRTCMKNSFECLSAFGGPVEPYMIVGGYSDEKFLDAKAIVITYVINNFKSSNQEAIRRAMAWEGQVLQLLKNYTSDLINVYYTTERSIEDEIERESKADIKIIAISYVMMFFYLTITLGKYSSKQVKVILLEMKIFLGLAGVTLVLLSVFSSGGFFTYLGVPATLITLEVIPFLLLAVGVDNIYVMVQTYQNDERREFKVLQSYSIDQKRQLKIVETYHDATRRDLRIMETSIHHHGVDLPHGQQLEQEEQQKMNGLHHELNEKRFSIEVEKETIEDQIARIVGKVGPSMLLTGTTQSCAFLISALTPMPGVRAFSLYASLAIIINFVMQITCFVALLTLDARREKAKRVDILCCFKLNLKNINMEKIKNIKSFLHRFFECAYTPSLLNNYVRASVVILFIGFFFACIALCDKLKVGLDQRLAMPSDSYIIKYFDGIQKHLSVGPPVYFVVKDGYNYSNVDTLRQLCGASQCESNSLQSLISSASFFPKETYIAQSSVNWIDDYMEWLSAQPPAATCCYVFKNTTNFCDYKKLSQSEKEEDQKLARSCVPCPVERVKYDFPSTKSTFDYVNHFLNQNPSMECIKAGHAMYGNAVKLTLNKNDKVTHIGCMCFFSFLFYFYYH
jgi:Niemann-Pick C1 protein